MTTIFWVEMTLGVSSCDQAHVDSLIKLLDEQHDGHVMYTYTPTTGRLALAMSTSSDEHIEIIPAKIVGVVRAAAHELGFGTPDWPEPVTIDDVRIKVLAPEVATSAC